MGGQISHILICARRMSFSSLYRLVKNTLKMLHSRHNRSVFAWSNPLFYNGTFTALRNICGGAGASLRDHQGVAFPKYNAESDEHSECPECALPWTPSATVKS